ncbi:MAG TPA: adenylate/guanylate cyclase domain-containing protein [Actinomycetota bacterium]|nr:adenylate/guanylate cyclase domain-containing protein [Actinomycetota bacterium]
MARFATPEEEWAAFLNGTHPHVLHSSPLRFVPSSPRCRLCGAPFRGPGGVVFRRWGYVPWEKNPNLCRKCFKGLAKHARACPTSGDSEVGGAEVELSMLFADVRGSSKIARQLPALEFTRLMNRFYRTSSDVLFAADAIVEKFVGDEVVGLFLPFLAGHDHTRKAIEAAQALVRVTGHASDDGPWIPIGAGVHRGRAFVGIVTSTDSNADFTALGDPVNVAAHLASQAAIGEVLVTDEAVSAASLDVDGLEHRELLLKDHPVGAIVVPAGAAVVPADEEPAAGR